MLQVILFVGEVLVAEKLEDHHIIIPSEPGTAKIAFPVNGTWWTPTQFRVTCIVQCAFIALPAQATALVLLVCTLELWTHFMSCWATWHFPRGGIRGSYYMSLCFKTRQLWEGILPKRVVVGIIIWTCFSSVHLFKYWRPRGNVCLRRICKLMHSMTDEAILLKYALNIMVSDESGRRLNSHPSVAHNIFWGFSD